MSCLNKQAVPIFVSPYRCALGTHVFPCEVTLLLCGSSTKSQLHFLGHKSRVLHQASEVRQLYTGLGHLRQAACRSDIVLELGTQKTSANCRLSACGLRKATFLFDMRNKVIRRKYIFLQTPACGNLIEE